MAIRTERIFCRCRPKLKEEMEEEARLFEFTLSGMTEKVLTEYIERRKKEKGKNNVSDEDRKN